DLGRGARKIRPIKGRKTERQRQMAADWISQFEVRLRNLGEPVDVVGADIRRQRQHATVGNDGGRVGKDAHLVAADDDLFVGIAQRDPHRAFQRAYVKNLIALDRDADLAAVKIVVRLKRIRGPKLVARERSKGRGGINVRAKTGDGTDGEG